MSAPARSASTTAACARPTAACGAARSGGGRLLLGANVQGRRNPKQKISLRYRRRRAARSTTVEDQIDTARRHRLLGQRQLRDRRSATASSSSRLLRPHRPHAGRALDWEYDGPAPHRAPADARGRSTTTTSTSTRTTARSTAGYTLRHVRRRDHASSSATPSFEDDPFEFEDEIEYLPRRRSRSPTATASPATCTLTDSTTGDLRPRSSTSATCSATRSSSSACSTTRRSATPIASSEAPLPLQPCPAATACRTPARAGVHGLSPRPGGDNTIEGTRIDPYVMLSGEAAPCRGKPACATRRHRHASRIAPRRTTHGHDYGVFLPSAHLRWELTDDDRISVSVARTVRRPSFNFLSPAAAGGGTRRQRLPRQSDLEPETAWGVDVGFEHRLGTHGRRRRQRLLPRRQGPDRGRQHGRRRVRRRTPARSASTPRATPATARSRASSSTFDARSTSSACRTPACSSTTPGSTAKSTTSSATRRFNGQSNYVYNVGFIHDLPALGRGRSAPPTASRATPSSRIVGEEVTTSYGGELEVFVEKRFGDSFTSA